MLNEIFKKTMRESENDFGIDDSLGEMDLVRAMGIYETISDAYKYCSLASDRSEDTKAMDFFTEMGMQLGEILTPLQLMFDELDREGRLNNKLVARLHNMNR